ncbi:MAG: aroF1, partial [Firmicutes bacterium]|nr:aroF1 [Bacillota bacterium]
MLVIMKPEAVLEEIDEVQTILTAMEVEVTPVRGGKQVVFALAGGSALPELKRIGSAAAVEQVISIRTPYKLASRSFQSADTVVAIGGCKVGGGHKLVIAGPCSVESEQQMVDTALLVKQYGAAMLRGGAYKPRTSPYSFQGAGEDGLKMLAKAREASGLPFVTEVMSEETFGVVEEYADLIQIGARNMQNFSL